MPESAPELRVFTSFEEAAAAAEDDWRSMTGDERLMLGEQLREHWDPFATRSAEDPIDGKKGFRGLLLVLERS